jgi:hypothetical protein
MKINLLTDAPKHNLALMKLSTWHKNQGDKILLNMAIIKADYTYASVLFNRNRKTFLADEYGGPAFLENGNLPISIDDMIPDYDLFKLDYSLGYTFRPCKRKCKFCKVPLLNHPDTSHRSIWGFHNDKFSKICLLNNNTFYDPKWKRTFEEIWDARLTVIDENGYDLRLIDEEKADALKLTRFEGYIHYAWDRMRDEKKILKGLKIAPRGRVYVLIGYDTTEEEDIYRCQKIVDYGHDPYIMPYNQSISEKRFKRFIDTFMWRKYKTIEKAWHEYT